MASQTGQELQGRVDAAWGNLSRQLEGMDPYLERVDASGEWTTREVLSHLLFEPGFDPPGFSARSPSATTRWSRSSREIPSSTSAAGG